MASNPEKFDKIGDQTQLLSDLSKQWASVRDLIESYANTYYLKQPLKKATAPEMVQAGLDFTSRVGMLWLKGLAITAKEGARMADEAVKAARSQE